MISFTSTFLAHFKRVFKTEYIPTYHLKISGGCAILNFFINCLHMASNETAKSNHSPWVSITSRSGVVPVHRVGVLVTSYSNVSMTLKIWQAVLPWTIFWQLCRPTQQQ